MFKEKVASIFISKTDEVINGNSPELWNTAIFMICDGSAGEGLQWIALKLSGKKKEFSNSSWQKNAFLLFKENKNSLYNNFHLKSWNQTFT